MLHVEVDALATIDSITIVAVYHYRIMLQRFRTHGLIPYGGIWGFSAGDVTALRGRSRNLNSTS